MYRITRFPTGAYGTACCILKSRSSLDEGRALALALTQTTRTLGHETHQVFVPGTSRHLPWVIRQLVQRAVFHASTQRGPALLGARLALALTVAVAFGSLAALTADAATGVSGSSRHLIRKRK